MAITLYQAKKRRHPTIKEYLVFAQRMGWAFWWHFTLLIYGYIWTDSRTRRVLKKLVDDGKLHALPYLRNTLIYTVPRIDRRKSHRSVNSIEHGLGVTEGYVRLWLSDKSAIYIPERDFINPRPEFGLQYPNGNILKYEYCTEDNMRMFKTKVSNHEGKEGTVLFVCDVDDICRYMKKYPGEYFITTYQAFKAAPYGHQLSACIYTYGIDGKTYPLGKDV
jgi:hypothetical protein